MRYSLSVCVYLVQHVGHQGMSVLSRWAQVRSPVGNGQYHTVLARIHPAAQNIELILGHPALTPHYAVYDVNTTYLLHVTVSYGVLRFKP